MVLKLEKKKKFHKVYITLAHYVIKLRPLGAPLPQVFPEILTQGQNEKKMSQPKLGHFQVPLGLVKSRGPKKVGISQPLLEILAQKGPKLAQMAKQLFRDLTIQKRPFPTCFNVLRMTPS